jgi:hypothetical protein
METVYSDQRKHLDALKSEWERITSWEHRAETDRGLWEQEAADAAQSLVDACWKYRSII